MIVAITTVMKNTRPKYSSAMLGREREYRNAGAARLSEPAV